MVRIHGNLLQKNIGVISVEYIETIMNSNQVTTVVTWIKEFFPELICAVNLKMSRQYVASVFGIQLMVRIHGNL